MPPKIYKSLDSLKPKLKQYEPHKIQRRIGQNVTVVFAVRYLKFDPKIPILDEDAFKEEDSEVEYECKLSDTEAEDSEAVENEQEEKIPEEHVETEPQVVQIDTSSDEATTEEPMKEEEILENGIDDNESDGSDKNVDRSIDDRIIVTAVEEDEFRKYDDEPELETVISKNRKKIKCDTPPPRPEQNARQPVPTPLPKPSPKKTTPILEATTRQEVPKQIECNLDDINKFLEQKNLRMVYVELNRRKETFKVDEVARATLKKAVSSCLERDETFMLMQLVELVFEFNFHSETKFWDELIGRLKRKDNPHAKVKSFKCDVDPSLVLRNYQRITHMIVEHFDSTNPTIALPWHTYRYLFESSQKLNNQNSGYADPIQMNVGTANHTSKLIETNNNGKAQENQDPAVEQRMVLFFKDDDGEQKFKIKVPKRDAKFNPKLLII